MHLGSSAHSQGLRELRGRAAGAQPPQHEGGTVEAGGGGAWAERGLSCLHLDEMQVGPQVSSLLTFPAIIHLPFDPDLALPAG